MPSPTAPAPCNRPHQLHQHHANGLTICTSTVQTATASAPASYTCPHHQHLLRVLAFTICTCFMCLPLPWPWRPGPGPPPPLQRPGTRPACRYPACMQVGAAPGGFSAAAELGGLQGCLPHNHPLLGDKIFRKYI